MPELGEVIIKPLVTEKGSRHREQNQFEFQVNVCANKLEIKRAIEKMFKVRVLKVRTMRVKGKTVRFRLRESRLQDWKKAIATLKEGDKIEFSEGI